MDPNATYDAMMQALMDGDEEAAREHAKNLRRWVKMGGEAPQRPDWDRASRNVLIMVA